MKFKKLLLYVSVCLLFYCHVAFTQITFQAQLLTPDIKTFFVSDLLGSETSVDIFQINIQNNSFTNQPCSVLLKIEKEAEGGGKELIGEGETQIFELLPLGSSAIPGPNQVSSSVRITNTNLFSNLEGLFALKGGFTITDAGDELQNHVLATGRLPSALYIFTLKLVSANSAAITPDDEYELPLDLRVSGSSTVNLINPGSDEYNPPIQIDTIFPNFQWDSGLDKFRLIVGEKLETMPGLSDLNPEEILRSRIVVDKILQKPPSLTFDPEDLEGEPILSNSYQYVGANLQFGRTYFYQLIGLIGSTSGDGEDEVPSEIWAFKVRDIAGASTSGLSIEAILNSLALIPGLDLALSGLFEEGGELYGYNPASITIGGTSATFAELAAFMAELNRDGKSSFNIVIEDVP